MITMKLQLFKNKDGYSNLVPMVLAIVITFAILFIIAYVNGTIHEELEDSFGNVATTDPASDAMATMNNTSGNWDSTLDIVQVVIIITILAAAVGAIFIFTRFR